MNVKPTVVRLTQEALDRIEKIAGPNQRAAFIREAVDSELERREAESQNSVQNGGDDGEKQ
jgi:metal-responsive CopG/Arc/MetJ family transcriptional regulator